MDLCRRIDDLVPLFQCDAIQVDVDEKKKDIYVSLLSPDVIIKNGRNSPFFEIITTTGVRGVSFKQTEDELATTFILSGIWDCTW